MRYFSIWNVSKNPFEDEKDESIIVASDKDEGFWKGVVILEWISEKRRSIAGGMMQNFRLVQALRSDGIWIS